MKKAYHGQINQGKTTNKFASDLVTTLSKQSGFSLVEVMVASIISIIILLAASSTFLTTYKLKEQVKTRISYEQDVRNTANLLRSDARQLGNFSCMSPPTANDLNNIFNGSFTDTNNKQFLSTSFVNTSIGVTPTTGNQPLVITYINEKYASNLVATDCYKNIPQLRQHVDAAVYVVGTTNSDAEPGLYRVNYSRGTWSAPQLLVSNVSDIQYNFHYDGHNAVPNTNLSCPSPTMQASSPAKHVENPERNQLDFNFAQPPVLITATLSITQNGETVNYAINAMVRQGEVCVNNQVQP
ncbi:MAG: prepilin-type N-terminal cleavage/methylation domain-containing protein [Snodgrassella sp.]|uniref:PilW family protein n=1 Tax=Snodgrassella sp. TaxID=2815304 RepID=UPI002586B15E|nr:prepilin-type N-terminal cleavage/methylation domain-containing protein [Snodgrassella sp.]MCO6507257.1 prepilin-type N-terminal cleavage/methylation domain-containing protein [Snodgrassella sp.]